MINQPVLLTPSILHQIKLKLSSYSGNGGLPLLKNSHVTIRNNNILKEALKAKPQRKHRPEAAVLVPICSVNCIPSILFTLRSTAVPTHQGEISFPGGHVHQDDESLEHTALREMQEELGFYQTTKTTIHVLGRTKSLPSLNGTKVTPIIAVINHDLSNDLSQYFCPNGKEVAQVFTRSILDLAQSETSEKLGKYENMVAPVFPGKEGNIWGLTAFILRPILKHILTPTLYPNWRARSSNRISSSNQ